LGGWGRLIQDFLLFQISHLCAALLTDGLYPSLSSPSDCIELLLWKHSSRQISSLTRNPWLEEICESHSVFLPTDQNRSARLPIGAGNPRLAFSFGQTILQPVQNLAIFWKVVLDKLSLAPKRGHRPSSGGFCCPNIASFGTASQKYPGGPLILL